MVSDTDIANMALLHVKTTKRIGNLSADNTPAGQAINSFFANTRDEVLRALEWPFATFSGALGLVATQPNCEWGYSYRFPSQCVYFRRIMNQGMRNPNNFNIVPWRIAADTQGKLLYTDMPSAQGEWTAQITDTSQFPPDFVTAFAYLLAAYISPGLSGSDPFKMQQANIQLYGQAIMQAKCNALNEQQRDRPGETDSILARDRGTSGLSIGHSSEFFGGVRDQS